MPTIKIELPFSSPPLSMNDRGMSRAAMYAKSAKTRTIRDGFHVLAIKNKLPRHPIVQHVTVTLHYQPRDSRTRDTDNLVATAKPIYDALAQGPVTRRGYGMVPDDKPQWMSKPEPIIHPAVKGETGRMWVELSWTENAA